MHTACPPIRALLALAVTLGCATPVAAAWQPGGVRLSPIVTGGSYTLDGLLGDPTGGAYAMWTYKISYPYPQDRTDYRLEIQRIGLDGERSAGWLETGTLIRSWSQSPYGTGVSNVARGRPLPDGSGGVYVPTVEEQESFEYFTNLHLYRISPSAAVTGVPGYSGNYTGPLVYWALADADGAGGVVYLASQHTYAPPPGPTPYGMLYTERVDATGSSYWWPDPGPSFTTSEFADGDPAILADGLGGTYFAWGEKRGSADGDLYLQRLDAQGHPVSGWPADGLLVCAAATAPRHVAMALDGSGGVFVLWSDQRDGHTHLYATAVLGEGALAAGVPVDGRVLPSSHAHDEVLAFVGDGQGGVFAARRSFDTSSSSFLNLHHLDGVLQPMDGWPAEGLALATARAGKTALLDDGAGGVFVATGGDGSTFPVGLRMFHWNGDGTVATDWPADGYRLSETGYEPLLARSGSGAIVAWVDDRSGGAGIYAARLLPAGLVAIEPPPRSMPGVALAAPRPNPASGRPSLAITLIAGVPARLEVLDLAGRRIAGRDLSALGAGAHVLDLDEAVGLPSGIYLVRLWQGTEQRTVRMARLH